MKQDDSLRDAVLLLARGALGASIAAHGTQKLFGWFDGPGLEGTTQMMDQLGFRPPEFYAKLLAATEVGAGVLIATGAFGPLGPMLLIGSQVTAVGSVHWKNGFWAQNQGFEMNLMYVLVATLLAMEDHGRLSFDHITGLRKRHNSFIGTLAVVAGAAAGIAALARRETEPAPNSETQQEWRTSSSETGTVGAPPENVIPDL